jgi:hypothetical protein
MVYQFVEAVESICLLILERYCIQVHWFRKTLRWMGLSVDDVQVLGTDDFI